MFSGSGNSLPPSAILSDVIASRKFKMAAVKPEICISQLIDNIATPFQRLTPIFGVQQLNGTIANPARCNRKSAFKDGGRQTGSSYISASRPDSDAVSKANPPFSGSSNSAALLRILPDVTVSRILKMAASKPEVLISQLLDKIATPFQRQTPHFLGPATQWRHCKYCPM